MSARRDPSRRGYSGGAVNNQFGLLSPDQVTAVRQQLEEGKPLTSTARPQLAPLDRGAHALLRTGHVLNQPRMKL